METLCAQVKLTALQFAVLFVLASSANAISSDLEQQLPVDEESQAAGQLGDEQPQNRSLLKIMELENSPNGSRGDVRLQERSAQLQWNENLSSERIAPPTKQLETTASEEKSLFSGSPILRRQRVGQTHKPINNKILADPFATEAPPVPNRSMQRRPTSILKPIQSTDQTDTPISNRNDDVVRVSKLNQREQPSGASKFRRQESSVLSDKNSEGAKQNESAIPESVHRRNESVQRLFDDAYTDDLPDHRAQQYDRQNGVRSTNNDRGTSSSSVSAVMTPRIRHTDNGIEVNFSDSDTGIYPIKESRLEDVSSELPPVIAPGAWQKQSQYLEQYEPQNLQQVRAPVELQDQQPDQNQEQQPAQQQDDTEVPSWDSILEGGDPPVAADPTTGDQNIESDNIVNELDGAQFGAGDDNENELPAESKGSANDTQSIEYQREGYRQALRQQLAAAPVQRIFQYLDDDGQLLPSSPDQRLYLLEFNGYRFSQVYNGECRIDTSGNSYNRMCAVWQTPDLCYNPLYFEEVNLERFGGRFPYAQPVISAAHFFSSAVTLPYAMGVQPPHNCYYSAGFGRPGNKYCYRLKRPVWSLQGATLQSLLITGLVFGLP